MYRVIQKRSQEKNQLSSRGSRVYEEGEMRIFVVDEVMKKKCAGKNARAAWSSSPRVINDSFWNEAQRDAGEDVVASVSDDPGTQ